MAVLHLLGFAGVWGHEVRVDYNHALVLSLSEPQSDVLTDRIFGDVWLDHLYMARHLLASAIFSRLDLNEVRDELVPPS